MGDRTCVTISVWGEDLDKFYELSEKDFGDAYDHIKTLDNGWVDLDYDEVNYAGLESLEAAAEGGCRFCGSHGRGADYEAYRFVSIGVGGIIYVPEHNGEIVAEVGFDAAGEPYIHTGSLEALRIYRSSMDVLEGLAL